MLNGPRAPRIVKNYVNVLTTVGSDIILPCKAVGRPRPEITWLNSELNIVNGKNEHVLKNGDLVISNISHGAKMYYCVAKNHIGKAKEETSVLVVSIFFIKFIKYQRVFHF